MPEVLDSNDPVLLELAEAVSPVTDQIDEGSDYGALILGAKFNEAVGDRKESVETFFAAVGYFDVIEEGLYHAMKERIDANDLNLFAVLRNVVRDIEEDLGISPEDELEVEDENPQFLH